MTTPDPLALHQPTAEHLRQLRGELGEEAIRTEPELLERYRRDEIDRSPQPPVAVVFPRTTEAVARVLRLAHRERIPVVPRGAGTGLSGGAVPVRGGLVLSLERMDRIGPLHRPDLAVDAEAGVVTARLQQFVEAEGLFYPPDPASSDSSLLGGNLAENSAGPRSARYGPTGRWVLGLEAVIPGGEILVSGGRTRKNVSGYDLTQLLVGSEGTLAVITRATLRLLPLPAERLVLLAGFASGREAVTAVPELLLATPAVVACEFLDAEAIRTVASKHPLPEALTGVRGLLLVELEGEESEALLRSGERAEQALSSAGAGRVLAGLDESDRRRMWELRRAVAVAVHERSPYRDVDAAVPLSALPELLEAVAAVGRGHGIACVCYGHAADGNLHVNLLQEGIHAREWTARCDAAEADLFRRVVELGGTITGEHGIGWTRRRHLPLVWSAAGLDLLRRIKRSFDPHGILNPGKIFPDDAG